MKHYPVLGHYRSSSEAYLGIAGPLRRSDIKKGSLHGEPFFVSDALTYQFFRSKVQSG